MRLFCVLLLSFALQLQGQNRPRKRPAPAAGPAKNAVPRQSAWPIGSLTVEGAVNYSPAQILAASGLKIGQTAGRDEFEAARNRLLSTGVFETVGYRFAPGPGGSSYAATLEVREIAQVYPLHFEGLTIDPKAAAEWLRAREPLFAAKAPGTQPVLSRYAAHIEEFLKRKGAFSQVVARVGPGPGDDLSIVFRPANLPSVAEVRFAGNESINEKELQRAVAGAAIGAVYTEQRFRQILDSSVRPLYDALGRIRAAFPKIESAPAKDVNGVAIVVTVQEGPVYTLGTVTASGADLSPALLKEARFKPGETANFDAILESVRKVTDLLRANGYVRAEVKPERKIDDAKRTVDLVLNADPGPQYTLGKVRIEGLDIQTEPHIRKLWAMKEGKPFNASYPEYFFSRLHSDGVFENLGKTRAELKYDDANRVVDVVLHFSADGKALPRIGPEAVRESQRRPAP